MTFVVCGIFCVIDKRSLLETNIYSFNYYCQGVNHSKESCIKLKKFTKKAIMMFLPLKNLNDIHNRTCKGRTGSPSMTIVPMMDENRLVIDASNSKRPFPGAALKSWISKCFIEIIV